MCDYVNIAQADALERMENALIRLGYSGGLLRRGYTYADVFGPTYPARTVLLAGFAQDPPSYRNACVGVVASNGLMGPENVAQHRALGAPLVFEIKPNAVAWWKVTRAADPQLLGSTSAKHLERAVAANQESWGPRQIFAAKTTAVQLDFVDLGLMAALEDVIQEKLDGLLRRTIEDVVAAHEDAVCKKPDPKELFRLVFRFVAAKILHDRSQPGPWASGDAEAVFHAVEEHYGRGEDSLLPTTIQSPRVLAAAWQSISSSFHFQNLSVDDLAFVYENTFVTPQTRKTFGTHSTPPHIAEYIVRKLPFETLPERGRRVLEPCAGHGIFLVSAMRRLRELLGRDLTHEDRHEYLRERLVGIESDSFAQEVSLLTLLLADYPNPNGWQLHHEDVFATGRLHDELRRADVVLCNPPFGAFGPREREQYGASVRHQDKAAELLARVLTSPPALLGFVLPKTFASGPRYAAHRHSLARSYGNVEQIALPDHVFTDSDQETIILLASDRRTANLQVRVTCRVVSRHGYARFRDQGIEPPASVADKAVPQRADEPFILWVPILSALWDRLEGCPRLSLVADVVRGVEWLPTTAKDDIISDEERDGWYPAYTSAEDGICQYGVGRPQFVDPQEVARHRRRHKWSEPKVIATKHAVSRTPWRMSAVTDFRGAVVTQEFYAVYAVRPPMTPEVIAAILNGPVANAWLYAWDDKRDNRRETCATIPIPDLARLDHQLIGSKVGELERALAGRIAALASTDHVRDLVLQIDAAVLHAYCLPAKLERELLALFHGVARPLPLQLSEYDQYYEAMRANMVDELHTRVSQRYQQLVDRKYLHGLGASEMEEMERLGRQMDDHYAPHYERLLSELRCRLGGGEP